MEIVIFRQKQQNPHCEIMLFYKVLLFRAKVPTRVKFSAKKETILQTLVYKIASPGISQKANIL